MAEGTGRVADGTPVTSAVPVRGFPVIQGVCLVGGVLVSFQGQVVGEGGVKGAKVRYVRGGLHVDRGREGGRREKR